CPRIPPGSSLPTVKNVIFPSRLNREKSAKGCGNRIHPRRAADAQLMSAAASPGRTWNSWSVERWLPFLAGKTATALPAIGGRFPDLPDMGGIPASAGKADSWNEGDPGHQPAL